MICGIAVRETNFEGGLYILGNIHSRPSAPAIGPGHDRTGSVVSNQVIEETSIALGEQQATRFNSQLPIN